MTVTAERALDSVRQLFEAELRRGLETGVQLSVSCRGEAVELAVGDNGDGEPMTERTYVPWTCSSKPLGALAFAQAWEAGLLDLDTTVCSVLAEYAGGGKETVTVRDLLSHTTGLADPIMSLPSGSAPVTSPEEFAALVWAVICAAPAELQPGTAMIYNPVANWFVLDRMLATVTGTQPGDSYRNLFGRLDLAASLGQPPVPAEQQVRVHAAAGQQAGLAAMQLASALPLPGVGVWGPMRELRQIGEVLLAKGVHRGAPLVGKASVEALIATRWPGSGHRSICDTDFPYGLGVMTLPVMFGRRCSVRTFGHAGGNTSTLLVDPLFDLVVAVYWNGRLDDVTTFARRYALVRALYHDLGLPRLPARGARPAAE